MRRMVVTLLALLLSVAAASAAALEWTYPLPDGTDLVQVLADGVGGVAFVQSLPDGTGVVVWLDSKGRTLYRRERPAATRDILGVTNRTLVLNIGEDNKLTVVDKSGATSDVPNAQSGTSGTQFTDPDKLVDASGFFAVATDPSTGQPTALARYSY